MSEQAPERMSLGSLADGQAVEGVYAVRERERRSRRNGGEFLRLVLCDATGSLEAVAWESVDPLYEVAEPGAAVAVKGRFAVHPRYGPKISVDAMRPALPGEYDPAELVDGPERPLERLEQDLHDLIATVQNPHLAALLDRFFGPGSQRYPRFREAPAAKYYHEAYPGGLLEHSLSVAQAVSAAASYFPGVDRDVAVTGALLHDVGKTEAYNSDPLAIDLTDAGRLQGEIPLGYYMVRRETESIDGFPADLAQAIVHIVLSHHGALEHGSPVVPATREATLVHALDNLGGKLGSFDRLERELPAGESWSRFDRAIEGAAYFGSLAA